MLNASAKEYVPVTVFPPSAPPPPPSKCSAPGLQEADGGRISLAAAGGGAAAGRGGCVGGSPGGKAQLSPAAPVFVPRAGTCATTAAAKQQLLETRPSDPSDAPRSVLTPPPSDSDQSSSAASRGEGEAEADGCGWVAGEGGVEVTEGAEGEEQPWAGFEAVDGDGLYDAYGCEQASYGDCYGAYSPMSPAEVMPAGEVMPQAEIGAYDAYGYGVYEGYTTQYGVGACEVDPQQGVPAVYYEAPYDGTAAAAAACYDSYPQGMYYWDEAAGAYVYNEAEYGCEYGNWQQQQQYENGGMATVPQQPFDTGSAQAAASLSAQTMWGAAAAAAAGPGSAAAAAADAELSLEVGLSELRGEGGVSVSGEQMRAMSPGDAAELLEMFFPHYAGTALSRLLERTEGDLLAAFAELAAMERQVGAERAAAAATASSSGRGPAAGGRSGGGGRGTAAAAAGRGAGGGKIKRSGGGGGGGAAGFQLDLEAFPSLPVSPAKPTKPATTTTTTATTAATTTTATTAATPGGDAESEAPQDAQPSTPTSTAADVPADAAAPSAATATPDRLNFATLLRSSATDSDAAAAVSTSSPAPGATFDPRIAGDAQSREDSGARTSGSGRGSGGAQRPRGPGAGPGTSTRLPARGGAAAASYSYSSSSSASSSSAAALAGVPWVSTGEAVAGQYAEERRDAAVLARARNQYFQQATLAYLSGNKALAKQLGRKGRELNEAMKAAHAAAARSIFAQRNGPHQQQQQRRRGAASATASAPAAAGTGGSGQGSRRQQQQHPQQQQQHGLQPQPAGGVGVGVGEPAAAGDVLFVDLHGLHVAEAVAMLEAQIEEARSSGCRLLRVCTGTGSHTKGARTPARLPAAVADSLLSNHLTFKTLKPGLLEARL